jgi:outer membrane lipopolysaccharide assembly protein LptE/RlpB
MTSQMSLKVASCGLGAQQCCAATRTRMLVPLFITLSAVLHAGCGYHVAGHSPVLPTVIHTIAVPPMENKTTTFKIEQILTSATIHEFLAKTNYKIVSDQNGGDAVLTAKVVNMEVVPLLFQSQPQSTATATSNVAQATAMMVTMKCEVTLTERDNDKVLYHTDNFVFRNQYQLSTIGTNASGFITPSKSQVEEFFQEGEPALGRMAQDFATRLVSAVTENF